MKMPEQKAKLDISFIHKIVRVGFYRYLIHNFGIVNRSFCQMNKCFGMGPLCQGMHFDCFSLMMEFCPRRKLKTQLNSAAVKGTDHFIQIKSKFLLLIYFLSSHIRSKDLIETPILLSIRFSQRGFWRYLDTKTVKIRRTMIKCSL